MALKIEQQQGFYTLTKNGVNIGPSTGQLMQVISEAMKASLDEAWVQTNGVAGNVAVSCDLVTVTNGVVDLVVPWPIHVSLARSGLELSEVRAEIPMGF